MTLVLFWAVNEPHHCFSQNLMWHFMGPEDSYQEVPILAWNFVMCCDGGCHLEYVSRSQAEDKCLLAISVSGGTESL
jgi:hypothetical protein